ncbi:SDR family oxidoreductase|uniref:SDR family oxidoreductase n=1 Tax=Noviherbaspirillum sp. L7-7A TaxID=2850560 RepID=UPI001C2C4CEC|nr:SDR family oxidoreductase [Noviherbaspirillum sp. L7-7A]MBV0880831.1 SDR family oxidoreductase [Noviherbaspirillum sp. L7-7A]
MPAALVMGASRGIGRELARQLLAAGWQVHATARTDAGLAELRAAGAVPLQLDVTRPESLAGLGWQLDGARLDLAVYVAGIYGPSRQAATAPPTQADFDAVMHANVLGAMQALPLVAPMVEEAAGRFVVISSGMGSIGEAESSHGWIYRASKAALNMAVRSAAFDYPKATLLAMCPGWVRTDMGGENAALAVEDSVAGMLKVILARGVEDSGSFWNHAGRQVGW